MSSDSAINRLIDRQAINRKEAIDKAIERADKAIVQEQARELAQLAIKGEEKLSLKGFLALALPGISNDDKEYKRMAKKCEDVAEIPAGDLVIVTIRDSYNPVFGIKADHPEGIVFEIGSTTESYTVSAEVPCSVATYPHSGSRVHIAKDPINKPYSIDFIEAGLGSLGMEHQVIHGEEAEAYIADRSYHAERLQQLRVGEQVATLRYIPEDLFQLHD